MRFDVEDIEEEFEYGDDAVFTVRLKEIDSWVLSVLENLPESINLKRYEGPVNIRERDKSYEVEIEGKRLYFPKSLYNRKTILKLLEERKFTGLLIHKDGPPFIEGIIFAFEMEKEMGENDMEM